MKLIFIEMNPAIEADEVPELRAAVGWERRADDYPLLLERCLFYAGCRDEKHRLVAFAYICGRGLQHAYLEDVMIHPDVQRRGIGLRLVQSLLNEASQRQIEIVTVSFTEQHASFYEKCGFTTGKGGVWRNE